MDLYLFIVYIVDYKLAKGETKLFILSQNKDLLIELGSVEIKTENEQHGYALIVKGKNIFGAINRGAGGASLRQWDIQNL